MQRQTRSSFFSKRRDTGIWCSCRHSQISVAFLVPQGKIPSNTSATYRAPDPTGQGRAPGQGRSLAGQGRALTEQEEAGRGRSPGQVWEQGRAEARQKVSEVTDKASRGLEQAKDSVKAASGCD